MSSIPECFVKRSKSRRGVIAGKRERVQIEAYILKQVIYA